MIFDSYSPAYIGDLAGKQFRYERAKTRLDGWFLAKELEVGSYKELEALPE